MPYNNLWQVIDDQDDERREKSPRHQLDAFRIAMMIISERKKAENVKIEIAQTQHFFSAVVVVAYNKHSRATFQVETGYWIYT